MHSDRSRFLLLLIQKSKEKTTEGERRKYVMKGKWRGSRLERIFKRKKTMKSHSRTPTINGRLIKPDSARVKERWWRWKEGTGSDPYLRGVTVLVWLLCINLRRCPNSSSFVFDEFVLLSSSNDSLLFQNIPSSRRKNSRLKAT